MVGKQLNAQNAVIKTATVEIKALTVSGRQVTQAVFRQLREEPLIAEDGTLNGVPWGYVNFHPDKCGDSRLTHWHIVWQRGEDLLRSRVNTKAAFDVERQDFESAEGNHYLAWWIYEWAIGKANAPYGDDVLRRGRVGGRGVRSDFGFDVWCYPGEQARSVAQLAHDVTEGKKAATRVCEVYETYHLSVGEPELHVELRDAIRAGVKVWLDLDRNLRIQASEENNKAAQRLRTQEKTITTILTHVREKEFTRYAELKAELGSAAAELREAFGWGECDEVQVEQRFRQANQAEADRRQRHRDVRATLAQLPQLFIAT